MLSPEDESKILRLYYAEKWPVGTIARQLGFHYTTVQRVLVRSGVTEAGTAQRPSMIEPYLPFVHEQLQKYPRLRASRLYEMVKARGYPGGPDHFRHLVALHRPKPPGEAFLRLRTLPGEQAQVDWGHFGKLRRGRGHRHLMAFVIVLSYSRQIFLRFYLGQRLENFLRGHEAAFQDWGGVPRVVLYDNLKSAVLERRGEAIRFHPTLLEFSGHYRFEPRPVGVRRANEKGRVERAIGYVRTAFFSARRWSDLEDLNAQALEWVHGPAAERQWPQERDRTVREVFEQERSQLLALPTTGYPTEERVEVRVGKTPYARFDGNDYTVPPTHVRRTLTVIATTRRVRILDGCEEVANHRRDDRCGEQIEDPAHLEALIETKRAARQHRGLDRLTRAVPECEKLLEHLARHGGHLGSATAALGRLLDSYGAAELEAAVAEVLEKDSPRPHDVRLVLERRRRERHLPPPLPIQLPDDPRVRNLVVRPHSLTAYDQLSREKDDDDERH